MIFLVYARYDSFIGFSLLPLMFVLLSIAEYFRRPGIKRRGGQDTGGFL